MGLFLDLAGIAQATTNEVEQALKGYTSQKSGSFEPFTAEVSDDPDILIVTASIQNNVTVFYPASLISWDDVSAYLSKTLNKPVFSFHIHDGDLWMYTLFVGGQIIDRFNPLPDYWGDITEEEKQAWAGNAEIIHQYWWNVEKEQIDHYLVNWSQIEDWEESEIKAYPDDEFAIGEDWQLTDFMSKLGLVYPIGDDGYVNGNTYRFIF